MITIEEDNYFVKNGSGGDYASNEEGRENYAKKKQRKNNLRPVGWGNIVSCDSIFEWLPRYRKKELKRGHRALSWMLTSCSSLGGKGKKGEILMKKLVALALWRQGEGTTRRQEGIPWSRE